MPNIKTNTTTDPVLINNSTTEIDSIHLPESEDSSSADRVQDSKVASGFSVDHSSSVKKEQKDIIDIDVEPIADVQSKKEHGGPKGLEPTRYGDWERKGRCVDF